MEEQLQFNLLQAVCRKTLLILKQIFGKPYYISQSKIVSGVKSPETFPVLTIFSANSLLTRKRIIKQWYQII